MKKERKPRGYWTAERCISEIKRLYSEGFDLSAGNTRSNEGSLYTKTLQLLGTWDNALSEAGVSPGDFKKKQANGYWTLNKILTEIKTLNESDFDLSAVNMQKEKSGLYQSAIKILGSWDNALNECDIDYESIKRKRANNFWTKHRVQTEIKKLQEAKKPLNCSAVDAYDHSLHSAARRVFGSWESALESVGINYDRVRLDFDDQMYYGKMFEKVVYDILNELRLKFIQNKEIAKGLKPDIVFPDGSIFDVKLSNYTDWGGKATSEKYGEFAERIGIIFLRGKYNSIEYLMDDVVFRHVSFYTSMLGNERQTHYNDLLDDLKRRSLEANFEEVAL